MTTLMQVDAEDGGRLRVAFVADTVMLVVASNDALQSLDSDSFEAVVNVPTLFSISTWHFSDTYDVATTNGTVTIENDVITYTPAQAGAGGFSINDQFVAIQVVGNTVGVPSLTYPPDAMVFPTVFVTLVGSPLQHNNPKMVHYASHWQIATDAAFTTLVVDEVSTSSLTYYTTSLTAGMHYFARVKYIGRTDP